ncbi:MAG TPA: CAP domain-containing protein [Nocardioidaceae bacterium]|nr:CAP domain-containing protein [Nocardioidaceae bacterium]
MVRWTRSGVRAAALLAAGALLNPLTLQTGAAHAQDREHLARTDLTNTTMSLQAREGAFAAQVFKLINRRRVAHGRHRVSWNRCVNGFATDWAQHLAVRDQFQHSNLYHLLSRCDAPYASENIAKFPATIRPARLVTLWMHSPEHRHNILSRHPTTTGVAITWDDQAREFLAVQNFVRRPGSYPN